MPQAQALAAAVVDWQTADRLRQLTREHSARWKA
jgi:hypothetical protein